MQRGKYIQENIDITELSNFRTHARARYFFTLSSENDIDNMYHAISWIKQNNLPILIVSGGTNMLFAFDIYNGLVIHNKLSGWSYDSHTKILRSAGAEQIWDIAEALESKYKQDLWHRFIGLPGSIAGAIYGNAGCFGLETEHNFVSCRVLNLDTGEIHVLTKQEMDFSYRSSLLKKKKKYFLISGEFDLSEKREKYHSEVDNIYFREHMQPKGLSCGSFFKNPRITYDDFIHSFPHYTSIAPKNISAGFLLELSGLKGRKIGGAYFSQQHANFLMHDGQGNWTDLLALIELAKAEVLRNFGLELENEVQIISS